jgi:hypothetical protein
MAKRTTHNEPGLGIFRSSEPLIKKPDRTAGGKDICAQAELDSVQRNRSIQFESERAKALRLQREAMAVDPNPSVPDRGDEPPLTNGWDDPDIAIP